MKAGVWSPRHTGWRPAAAALSKAHPSVFFRYMISDSELLELSSGADSLDQVKDLVVRGRQLETFEPYACKLPALEAISLSHNRLTSLSGFSNLPFLTTLNVSNNELSSLDGLQACHLLRCLYASNNVIRELSPIANLRGLRVLHLVKNPLSALRSVLDVVISIGSLSDLDLSGTPVSQVPEYKKTLLATVAQTGQALALLDGDTLTPLDLEMALEGESTQVYRMASTSETIEASSQQATADDQALPELQIRGPSVPMQNITISQRPMTSSQMRPGTSSSSAPNAHVRLVADELLNDHPVLLEYLASHVLKEGFEALNTSKAELSSGPPLTVSKMRGSFVNRLRGTAAASSATEGKTVKDLVASGQDMISATETSQQRETKKAQLAAAESLVMGASPQETIRQLVRLCEVLIRELQETRVLSGRTRPEGVKAPLKDSQVPQLEAEVQRLTREVKQLQQENANVSWLADQYRQMKSEAATRDR